MMDSLLLWAKLDKKNSEIYHPPLFHLIDTATVTKALLTKGLSPYLVSRLSESLEINHESLLQFAPFLSGSHDLGKIAPDFQFQNDQGSEIAKKLMGESSYSLWQKIESVIKFSTGLLQQLRCQNILKILAWILL